MAELPPPRPDQDQDHQAPIVYPYRKRPAHLTAEEDQLISEACHKFQRPNYAFDKAEEFKNLMTKARAEQVRLEEPWRKVENELAEHERAAIRTSDPTERKKLEEKCKELRTLLIGQRKRVVEMEQGREYMAGEVALIEEMAQDATISNVISLVNLCKSVRRRREEEDGDR